jgi:hypothetical protein
LPGRAGWRRAQALARDRVIAEVQLPDLLNPQPLHGFDAALFVEVQIKLPTEVSAIESKRKTAFLARSRRGTWLLDGAVWLAVRHAECTRTGIARTECHSCSMRRMRSAQSNAIEPAGKSDSSSKKLE